jgi:genome maintenance exonuclease 1|tara:strand:+ start:1272 stop:1934 length:663 start_codon:yes stop_codon:yes gene_type:complete
MFNHVKVDLPDRLKRVEIDGKRFYQVPGEEDLKLVSVTTVTSFQSAKSIKEWRQRVGEEVANRKTRRATSRGTDMHTLVEYYLKNETLPSVQPLSEFLFKFAKPTLDKIDNIHALESPLYSKKLGIAGTVDCIAEYEGELAVIDFKTSEKPKPEKWIEGYFVQAVAYACMLYELTGIIVKKLVIIMSCENGECVVYEKRNKSEYIRKLTQYIREWKTANE